MLRVIKGFAIASVIAALVIVPSISAQAADGGLASNASTETDPIQPPFNEDEPPAAPVFPETCTEECSPPAGPENNSGNCPPGSYEIDADCVYPKDPSQDPYNQGNAPTGGGPNETWYVTYVEHESPYLEALTTLDMLMKVLFGALIGLAAGFLVFDRRPSQF